MIEPLVMEGMLSRDGMMSVCRRCSSFCRRGRSFFARMALPIAKNDSTTAENWTNGFATYNDMNESNHFHRRLTSKGFAFDFGV